MQRNSLVVQRTTHQRGYVRVGGLTERVDLLERGELLFVPTQFVERKSLIEQTIGDIRQDLGISRVCKQDRQVFVGGKRPFETTRLVESSAAVVQRPSHDGSNGGVGRFTEPAH